MEKSGLIVGQDIFLAFSPERVDPGNQFYNTKNTPKVVGGITPACTEVAAALYESILEGKVHQVSSPAVAEMEKILENSIPVMVLWIAAGVLMVPFFHPAVFHVMVCPFGALQKIFGRSVFRSEEVDPRSCIGCRKCEKVCPSKAIVVQKEEKKARIQKDLCFQCKACEGVCPTDSIHYR